MAENKDAANWIKEVHETGATAGYFLVVLHALAALYHRYFQHDNTLRRMLPKSK
jgi:cytochrome b561